MVSLEVRGRLASAEDAADPHATPWIHQMTPAAGGFGLNRAGVHLRDAPVACNRNTTRGQTLCNLSTRTSTAHAHVEAWLRLSTPGGTEDERTAQRGPHASQRQ